MFYAHARRRRVQLDCGDQVITKQSHKEECDIHNILRQYSRTGVIEHIARGKASYDELPDPIDYQQALNIQLHASEVFGQLPAAVRDSFRNDPAAFLAAFQDPAQEARLRDLGLLKPKPATPVAEQDATAS